MTTHTDPDTLACYSNDFFDKWEEGMLRSARLVAPTVLRLISPATVLDIGCGRGAWLQAFQELGVSSVRGIDGTYVDRTTLLIGDDSFTHMDLSRPFSVPGSYDLAICLEVGEHLPKAMAPVLVEQLVKSAPAVLFSAALPGQGGTHHINEQMPSYWRALFRRHGYVMLDAIRPAILTDNRIEWWYRQNMVLYGSEEAIRRTPELDTYRVPEDSRGIEWVQAFLIDDAGVRKLCSQLVFTTGRAVRRRTRRLFGHPELTDQRGSEG